MKKIMVLFLLFIIFSGITITPSKAKSLGIELDYAGSYSEGYAVVGVWDGKWNYGYMNLKREIVIKPQFNYAEPFQNGLAVVGIGKDKATRKYGYINDKGKYILEPEYDYVETMSDKGMANVGTRDNGPYDYKYGIVDDTGEFIADISNNQKTTFFSLEYGFMELSNDSLYGFYNLKTKKKVEPKYDQVIVIDTYVMTIKNINGKDKYGLYFANDVCIEPIFDRTHHFSGIDNVAAMVELDGKFGLVDTKGKYILETVYDEIRSFKDGTTQVKKDGKYGYLDSDGHFLTNIEFEQTVAFHKGLATVKKDGKYGVLSINGSYILKPIYDKISIRIDNIEATLNGEKKIFELDGSSRYGFEYDKYLYPYKSIEGAALVEKDGKQVVIDSKGNPIFKVDFDKIGNFNDGVARIELKGKIGLLGEDGKYIAEPIYDSAYKNEDNTYLIKTNELYGIILQDGTVIKPMSTSTIKFSNNYGIITVDGKETYINKSGKRISSESFDDAYPFSDGMAMVKINDKYSYINTEGKRIDKEFIHGYDYSDGYACVKEGQSYRYIDKKGNLAFGKDRTFSNAKPFSNGMAAFRDKKWGYIDTSGKEVIKTQFDCAYYFGTELAPVKMGDKFGIINKTGKLVFEAKYDYVTEFVNGKASIWKGNNYSYITSEGEIVSGKVKNNENINFIDGIALIKIVNNDVHEYRYGYIKEDGSWLVKPELEYGSEFSNGEAYFYKDNKLGYVDTKGKIRWK